MADLPWLPAVLAVVLVVDVLGPRVRAGGRRIGLGRLHAWIGRLPPGVALPLFLLPEACSRLGWVASATLVLLGRPLLALAVYAGSKLIAGGLAIWVYLACRQSLLRVGWFARGHGHVLRLRAGLSRRLPRALSQPGRFAAVLAEVRRRRAA